MSQRTHYEVKRMTAESGPLSSWVDSMALETRQFMALNAMNEALFIARNLTMDFFFCPAIKMEVNGEQARTAALSVFAPLFDEVDTQMDRNQVHKKNIGKVVLMNLQVNLLIRIGLKRINKTHSYFFLVNLI